MAEAIEASFHTTKFVLGRKVIQIVLETDVSNADKVFDVLGYPNPESPQQVVIAPIRPVEDETT